MKFYHPADPLSNADIKAHGNMESDIRLITIGEYRAPRKGEWFISGPDHLGFKASYDLHAKFYIAKLVETYTTINGRVVED